MKLQEQQPSDLPIHKILKDNTKRETVVRSLLQALSSFGYTETIKSLEKQSKIIHQKSRIQRIQSLLKHYQYKAVREQIQFLQLTPSIRSKLKQSLQELQLFYLISKGFIEEALEFLANSNLNQQKKLEYCQIIALDGQLPQPQYLENKSKEILQRCRLQTISEQSVQAILTEYLQNDAVDGHKHKIEPPKILAAQSIQKIEMTGKVNFIKFNKRGDKLAIVSQSDKRYELAIWQINNKLITKRQSYNNKTIGFITSVKWGEDEINQVVGICSYQNFILFNTNKLAISFVVNRKEMSLPRFLCFSWNPISQIIYIGGLFPKLFGVNSLGDVITQINPFLSLRELVFSPKGQLFTIGATKEGHLIKYSLQQQKIEKEFIVSSIFMDLKYYQEKVIVSNNQYIYVIDADTLTPIYTIDSPLNESLFKIEVFFCGPWIISYNQKLRGTLRLQKLLRQVKWQNCDAVDIIDKKMITCNQSLKLWQSLPQDQQEYESIQSLVQQQESIPSSSSSSSSSNSNVQQQDYRQLMQIQYINAEQQIEEQ